MLTALIIYIDDMVVIGVDDAKEIQRLQMHLSFEFKIKELWKLKYFLMIEVAKGSDNIILC